MSLLTGTGIPYKIVIFCSPFMYNSASTAYEKTNDACSLAEKMIKSFETILTNMFHKLADQVAEFLSKVVRIMQEISMVAPNLQSLG